MLPAFLRIGCMGLASLLLAAAATPAAAKERRSGASLSVRAATAIAGDREIERISATAKCPGRKRAVGGGFATSTGGADKVIVYSSYRADKRSWVNEAVASAGASLTSYVHCRRLRRSPTESTAPTVATGEAPARATASCPGGRKAVAGGFSAATGPTLDDFAFPSVSARRGDGWTVEMTSSVGRAQAVTAHVYCAKRRGTPRKKTGASSGSAVPPGGVLTAATGRCPRGRGGAGGFTGSAPDLDTTVPFIVTSRLAGRRWIVSSVNDAGEGPISLGAQAICS